MGFVYVKSGSTSQFIDENNYIKVQINWTQYSDVQTNQSKFTINSIYFASTWGGGQSFPHGSIQVNGTTILSSNMNKGTYMVDDIYSADFSFSSRQQLKPNPSVGPENFPFTVRVQHDSNGNASPVQIKFVPSSEYYEFKIYMSQRGTKDCLPSKCTLSVPLEKIIKPTPPPPPKPTESYFVWICVDGAWRKAIPWICVDGNWHKTIPWICVDNGWRRCGSK